MASACRAHCRFRGRRARCRGAGSMWRCAPEPVAVCRSVVRPCRHLRTHYIANICTNINQPRLPPETGTHEQMSVFGLALVIARESLCSRGFSGSGCENALENRRVDVPTAQHSNGPRARQPGGYGTGDACGSGEIGRASWREKMEILVVAG